MVFQTIHSVNAELKMKLLITFCSIAVDPMKPDTVFDTISQVAVSDQCTRQSTGIVTVIFLLLHAKVISARNRTAY